MFGIGGGGVDGGKGAEREAVGVVWRWTRRSSAEDGAGGWGEVRREGSVMGEVECEDIIIYSFTFLYIIGISLLEW